jgi:hypothetical protein
MVVTIKMFSILSFLIPLAYFFVRFASISFDHPNSPPCLTNLDSGSIDFNPKAITRRGIR